MIFLVFFAIICSTILTNLFIAMISKTIGDMQETAKPQYQFNFAVTVAYYGSKEAIPPPFNLLHIGATLLGIGWSKLVSWLFIKCASSTLPLFRCPDLTATRQRSSATTAVPTKSVASVCLLDRSHQICWCMLRPFQCNV